MSLDSGKAKSLGSAKLQRQGSKRSRRSSRSGQSQQSLDISSSKDASVAEASEAKPEIPINYREELTFLFFNAILEENTVDSRAVLPPRDASDVGLAKSILNTTFTKDFKEIQEGDLKNYSVVSVDTSKLVFQKNGRKPNSVLSSRQSSMLPNRKSSSVHSKKIRSSKQSSLKAGSSTTLEDSKKSSQRETIQSIQTIDGKQEWILRVDDKFEEISFTNGNKYIGQTSRSLMHGKGAFYWADGTVYEGYFKDGYPHGAGQITLPDLSIYEGEFFRGYFHGSGAFRITATPVIYSGSWKHGRKHGSGWLLWEAKNWYDGDWCEDEKHGFGYRRYKNGTRYKGMWADNKKNGEGSMIWKNNDYYVGEWEDDKPHGYGEYTWNLYFNKSFAFPYYNWYKGSWVEGLRTGAGIMDFGTNSGAKLAGMWVSNMKHGPGVMICGNGAALQRNPLFENDKPVHKSSLEQIVDEAVDDSKPASSILLSERSIQSKACEIDEKVLEKDVYQHILKEIHSKVALKAFDSDTIMNITKSGLKISETKFVELAEEDIPEAMDNKWCPLELSIHTIAEEVDLNYYIEKIISHYFENSQKAPLLHEFEYINTDVKPEDAFINHCVDHEYVKKNEERLLKHLITAYLPQLTGLYNQYSSFARNEETPVNTVLIRLFLWQLLRDIGLPQQSVSLVETDLFLAENISSCVEAKHDPFEPIYFWQFLLALVGSCWLLFLTAKEQKFDSLTNGVIAQMFKQFLEYKVFPNAGKFEGYALTEYRDLLPIRTVYDLYLKIGEPHSVRVFLHHTCVKKGKHPPCYAAIKEDTNNKNLPKGNNVVMLSHRLMYLEEKDYVTQPAVIQEENPDIFYRSLYTFRTLGKRKIVRCLAKVCPNIFSTDGNIDIGYKLNFLEFYEAILQCAYEKAERKRRIEEKRKRQEYLELLKESEPPAEEKDKGKKKKQKK